MKVLQAKAGRGGMPNLLCACCVLLLRLQAPAQVLLLVEATTTSGALQWVAANALRPGDHLHLLCTSPPTARLVRGRGFALLGSG